MLQYLHATLRIRQRHYHIAIEATRSHQCSIQYTTVIGGADHNQAGVLAEAIHFSKQRIDGGATSGTLDAITTRTYCINLILNTQEHHGQSMIHEHMLSSAIFDQLHPVVSQ